MNPKITPEDKAFLASVELRMPTKYDALYWRSRIRVQEMLAAEKKGKR